MEHYGRIVRFRVMAGLQRLLVVYALPQQAQTALQHFNPAAFDIPGSIVRLDQVRYHFLFYQTNGSRFNRNGTIQQLCNFLDRLSLNVYSCSVHLHRRPLDGRKSGNLLQT
jgi:hypothetical protein